MTCLDNLAAAISDVRHWLKGDSPQIAIVLGSGWSGLLGAMKDCRTLPYDQLTGFPRAAVAGHEGLLHQGTLFGVPALVFQGRYHYYEGYSAWQVTAQVRLSAALECSRILLTNAVGGIAPNLSSGRFMQVTDHINMTGINPLAGRPERDFIDLGALYRTDFYHDLCGLLAPEQIGLERGVLAWMPGPSYETPAEIRALECLGADAVTMSTVPEAVMDRRCGLDLVALSLVTNAAAGKGNATLSHEDVLAAGHLAEANVCCLVDKLLSLWFSS